MAKKGTTSKSYLLRLAPEGRNGRQRVLLKEIGDAAHVLHFADIDHFIDFLLTGHLICEKKQRPLTRPDTRSVKKMVTMFVRHKVQNYPTWRKAYDDFDETRRGLGVKGDAVYQAADDELDVTVTHDFNDLDSATRFAKSDELRTTMAKAGVASPPDIWFTKAA